MKIIVFFLSIALFPMSLFAAEVSVCLPEGRSEFLQVLVDTAVDHGFFAKRDLKVAIERSKKKSNNDWKIDAGRVTKPRLLDYKIGNFVAEGDPKCIFGASTTERFIADARGQDQVVPLFVSNYGDQYDTHVLVAKDSKLKSAKELKGKKLRIGQLPTYVAMMGLLESNGLTIKDVKMEYGFGGSEKLAALNDGRLDAATAYLPGMAYLLATDKVKVLEPNIVSRFVAKRIPHSLLIVNKTFARKNPKSVEAFNEAIRESYAYIMRNRAEIFYSFARHNDVTGEWKIEEGGKADIEKAASFVGTVSFTDLTKESADRDQVYCDLKNYGGILVQRGFLSKQEDLGAWLGVKPEKAKGCPVQNAVASSKTSV
jgi:hypothetical protein